MDANAVCAHKRMLQSCLFISLRTSLKKYLFALENLQNIVLDNSVSQFMVGAKKRLQLYAVVTCLYTIIMRLWLYKTVN